MSASFTGWAARIRYGGNPRVRLAVLGLAATALIALVALASRSSALPSGEGQVNVGPVLGIVHLVEIVGLAVELLVILLLIVFFRPKRRKKDDELQRYVEPVRVHWAIKLLIIALPFLFLGAVVLMLMRLRPTDQTQEPMPIGMPPPLLPGGNAGEGVGAGLGLGWWEVAIAIVLAVVAFVAILRALRMPPPTPRSEPESQGQAGALATAVTAGLRDARREPNPRRAVIAAYATMEALLAAAGLPRRRVEAPFEYLARLFGEIDVSGEAMRTLTDLFELARFSHHDITPAARERAIAALAVIEHDLQAGQ